MQKIQHIEHHSGKMWRTYDTCSRSLILEKYLSVCLITRSTNVCMWYIHRYRLPGISPSAPGNSIAWLSSSCPPSAPGNSIAWLSSSYPPSAPGNSSAWLSSSCPPSAPGNSSAWLSSSCPSSAHILPPYISPGSISSLLSGCLSYSNLTFVIYLLSVCIFCELQVKFTTVTKIY